MISLMLVGLQLKPGVFEKSISPSQTWGITYKPAPGHSADDYVAVDSLINVKTKKAILTLKGFDGFPGQNHGGMNVVWTKSENFGLVVQAGKWEPRAVALVSPRSAAQLDLFTSLKLHAKAFEKRRTTFADKFVFDLLGAKLTETLVTFSVVGQIPKDETTAPDYFSIQYPIKVEKGKIIVGDPKVKLLTEQTSWSWPDGG